MCFCARKRTPPWCESRSQKRPTFTPANTNSSCRAKRICNASSWSGPVSRTREISNGSVNAASNSEMCYVANAVHSASSDANHSTVRSPVDGILGNGQRPVTRLSSRSHLANNDAAIGSSCSIWSCSSMTYCRLWRISNSVASSSRQNSRRWARRLNCSFLIV